ncbi:MAG: PAS domain-containing sensor histidine kinase, partial [Bacteroidetes bacterium]|nr:PAS domain-containing sensor histidine kinase [Bacteroidota bacterium]
LERFAYVASHDLHEPLRKLYAFSEILIEREKNLSIEGLEIIRRMHTFVTRMQQLIDDMLQFSLNLNKVEKVMLDLNAVVKNVINNLAVKMNETNASIEVAMLPAQVEGYESQINQLFQNIISNSIKYSRPGVPPHIRITATEVPGSDIEAVRPIDEKKRFHKITLSDNGIGFDDKYREKIFVIFQRLHGKSEYSGSGIGLATAKRVVDNHNGYITAHGEENKGAEFNIYLPKE